MIFNSKRLAMHIEEDKLNLIIYTSLKSTFKIEKMETINYNQRELLNYVRENKLKRARVDLVLGGKDVISRNITIPYMPPNEIIKTLRWELAKHIPLDLDEIIFDYTIINENVQEKTTQILVVAMKKKIIEKHCDTIISTGLNPRIVDTEGTIFKYLFKNIDKKDENNACLFFLNNKRGVLSFIVDNKVSFIHNFEIKTNTGIEIVEEYNGVLNYLCKNFNFSNINDIFIFGDNIEASLYRFLADELDVNIIRGELSANNKIIFDPAENEKRLALFSLGLVLREA